MSRYLNPLIDIDVIVLAGGKGERLRAALPGTPKVLAPVCGKPFIDHIMNQMKSAGARRVVLSLGWLHKAVQAHVEHNSIPGMEIICAVESEPRGTGGGLLHASRSIRTKRVCVMNGDTYAPLNFMDLVDFHVARKARCSLVAVEVDAPSRYGCLRVNADGRVTSFLEKQSHSGRAAVNAGIYLMESEVLHQIPSGRVVSLEREVIPSIDGLYAMVRPIPFLDIGTPESLSDAERFFKAIGQ